MRRSPPAVFVLLLMLAPASGFAQKEPQRTKEVRDAEKFVTSALIAPDSAEKKSRLERALNPLQVAMTKTPDNALVWFTAGQVYAGLADYARADSAFDRAEQLHPPLREEIRAQRASAWLQAAGAGEALMNSQQYPQAISRFEQAEALYDERPESKINLAVLYANAGEYARSEVAYRSVIDLHSVPVNAEDSSARGRFREIATIRLAQLMDRRGVEAFEAQRYDDAVAAFSDARALNPHARDHAFNLAQSIYAQARALEDARKDIVAKDAAQSTRMGNELVALYTRIDPILDELRMMDPSNEDLFILPMRSFRVRGDLTTDAAAKTRYSQRAAEMFKLHQERVVELVGVAAGNSGSDGFVRGTLRNLKLKPDAPVNVRVTLLALDGRTIGGDEFAIAAPAADLTTPFELTMKVTGEVAAWKYEILK